MTSALHVGKISLAILTALNEEKSAVNRGLKASKHPHPHILVLRGGVGAQSASLAVDDCVSQHHAASIVSSGFCGGLSPTPRLGEIVIASQVLDGSGKCPAISCDKQSVKKWHDALKNAGLNVHVVSIVSVNTEVTSCAAKEKLFQQTGALAVDMESYAIAKKSQEAGIPFIVIRTISDTSQDALPPEVSGFLNTKGNVRLGNIAKFVLKRPRNFKVLLQLKSRSDQAGASLSAAWKILAPLVEEYKT